MMGEDVSSNGSPSSPLNLLMSKLTWRDNEEMELRNEFSKINNDEVHALLEEMSKGEGQARVYNPRAVCAFAMCAVERGHLVIQLISLIMHSILRQLSEAWSNSELERECSDVIECIVKNAPRDETEAGTLIDFIAKRLADGIRSSSDNLISGSSACLHKLINSEKWHLAGVEALKHVWTSLLDSTSRRKKLSSCLKVTILLVRKNQHQTETSALTKSLLASCQDILVAEGEPVDEKLLSVRVCREILTRCDDVYFVEECETMQQVLQRSRANESGEFEEEAKNFAKILEALKNEWTEGAFVDDSPCSPFAEYSIIGSVSPHFHTPITGKFSGVSKSAHFTFKSSLPTFSSIESQSFQSFPSPSLKEAFISHAPAAVAGLNSHTVSSLIRLNQTREESAARSHEGSNVFKPAGSSQSRFQRGKDFYSSREDSLRGDVPSIVSKARLQAHTPAQTLKLGSVSGSELTEIDLRTAPMEAVRGSEGQNSSKTFVVAGNGSDLISERGRVAKALNFSSPVVEDVFSAIATVEKDEGMNAESLNEDNTVTEGGHASVMSEVSSNVWQSVSSGSHEEIKLEYFDAEDGVILSNLDPKFILKNLQAGSPDQRLQNGSNSGQSVAEQECMTAMEKLQRESMSKYSDSASMKPEESSTGELKTATKAERVFPQGSVADSSENFHTARQVQAPPGFAVQKKRTSSWEWMSGWFMWLLLAAQAVLIGMILAYLELFVHLGFVQEGDLVPT